MSSDSEDDYGEVMDRDAFSSAKPIGRMNRNDTDSDDEKDSNTSPNPYEHKIKSPNGLSSPSSSSSSSSPMNSFEARGMNVQEFAKHCIYIPMRLSEEERVLLSVLENALEVSEYTDVVDVTFSHTRKSKTSRIFESLIDVLSISCGLLMSNNLSKGEELLSERTLNDNVPLFKQLFEIGRRFKIMNPTKMRGTYGKLIYILMDTESYTIKEELKIDFVKPILTVAVFLKSKGMERMLLDPLLLQACTSINSEIGGKTKADIDLEISNKAQAVHIIKSNYQSESLTEDDIQRIIDSIGDNEAFMSYNARPVEKMIKILKDSFNPRVPGEFSLELSSRLPKRILNSFSSLYGYGYSSKYNGSGACLSHDHSTQYTFVLQSLTLWNEIMWYMPKLWMLADHDMTNQQYRLVETGQGYQRLQSCPSVGQEMRRILGKVQNKFGSWVGLSVIHLGDRDVPNAFIFIDKYTQVSRILAPIVQCIERLPNLVEDNAFHQYVSKEWGSIDGLRLQVLSDFFKHGFDGSGDDGGSCIDGRLTSAWNWCSKLHKKPYYHVFMFTGFQGFDGDWKEDN